MKIVLTGGAGFIGSHIADLLIKEGHKLTVIDNLSSGKIENVPPLATFYNLDILDPLLGDILKKEAPEVIIHHAARYQCGARLKIRCLTWKSTFAVRSTCCKMLSSILLKNSYLPQPAEPFMASRIASLPARNTRSDR